MFEKKIAIIISGLNGGNDVEKVQISKVFIKLL